MRRSILVKNFGSSLLIILLLAALILLVSFRLISHHYQDNLARDLEKLGKALELRTVELLTRGQIQDLDAFYKQMGKMIQIRLTFVRPDGLVLADSDEDPKKMVNHRYRQEIILAFQGKIGRAIRFSETVKADMLYVALPVWQDEEFLGCLRVSSYFRDIDLILSGLRKNMALTVILIAALALLLAFWVSRSFTRPIRQMIDTAGRIASGQFGAKVYISSKDELGRLGSSLNAMSEQIRALFSEVASRKEELEGIISSMEEGLLVIDREGRILLANDSFRRMSGQANLQGQFHWEAVRSSSFNELVRQAREEKETQSGRVTLRGRFFLCHASFLSTGERVAVTFADLTEVVKAERVKKELTVNVSHELRTPLAAIKGYAETIEGETGGQVREYTRVILRHTDRLIRIVDDLLLLSEMEEKGLTTSVEKVDLLGLLEDVLKIFEPRAREKNVSLRIVTKGQRPSVSGDPFKLEQMFINLIDNAVKYTDRGEVVVTLESRDKEAAVEVRDTGRGIEEEHLPRIFERFYVVDKSRARQLGGTGLGLSIVKHIVLLHQGRLEVESRPGQGTRFTVLLPLSQCDA